MTSRKLRETGDADGRRGRAGGPQAALVATLGRAAGRHLHELAHNLDPRPGACRPRHSGSIGSQRALGLRSPRTLDALDAVGDRARRSRHRPHAEGGARRPHGRAPPPLRRFHAGDPVAHAAPADRPHRDDPDHRRVRSRGGDAHDRAKGRDPRGNCRREPRQRRSDPARAAVRPALRAGSGSRARSTRVRLRYGSKRSPARSWSGGIRECPMPLLPD